MKICFLDSRYKTVLFDYVAKSLIEEGVDVHWIVQNKTFLPKNGNVHLIKYPKKNQEIRFRDAVPNDILWRVAKSDRMVKYFSGGISHYGYYWVQINKILEDINPDIVIGEPGNFHTHLSVYACKIKGVPFLDPETARYPTSRFRFHCGDKLEFYESGDGKKQRADEVRKIIERKSLPDYMKQNSGKGTVWFKTIMAQFVVFYSRMMGDIYTVPSLKSFLLTKKESKYAIKRWESLVNMSFSKKNNKKILLYPMQMQPEFNLDVWGYDYNNQAELIDNILKNLPENWTLMVKPNPKSKLEMTDALLEVTNNERVIRLSHSVLMDDVISIVDGVITVTGTIGIERALAGKKVVALGYGSCYINGKCIVLKDLTNLPDVLDMRQEEVGGMDGEEYMNYLYSNSFSGTIAEPIVSKDPLRADNIAKISDAVLKVSKELIS